MGYDPEGPVAKQLVPLLKNELTTAFNIPDDAQDTADYINVLIGQNRSAADICADVKDIVNIPINEQFMSRVFDEITRLDQVHNQQAFQPQEFHPAPMFNPQPQPQPQQQQQQQPQPQQHQEAPVENQASVFPPPMQGNPFQTQSQSLPTPVNSAANPVNPSAFPTGPMGQAPAPQFPSGPQGASKSHDKKDVHVNFSRSAVDFKRNGGGVGKASGISKTNPRAPGKSTGVGKDYVSGNKGQKKSFGLQNPENLQKALALATEDSVNMQPFTPRPPKGRCPDFPYCKNRECALAHPTKKCFAFPNCPNPPGACDFLHPSEDGELMQELEKTKQQFLDRRSQKFAPPQVTLCKYGVLCSKELCPFGHPTPANKDAKVHIQRWCRENKNCQNENCEYAHSSPNYQAPAPAPKPHAPAPAYAAKPGFNKHYAPRTPTTLEQCKFGLNCTNASCPKRHSTSMVACRAGYNCTRMDCTFNHPLAEECRFGNECRNKPCYYKHPDAREASLFGGQQNGGHNGQSTMDRTFAVAEDQVMEHATQI